MATDERLLELVTIAWKAGIRAEAVEDVLLRAQAYMETLDPDAPQLTPRDREQWQRALEGATHLHTPPRATAPAQEAPALPPGVAQLPPDERLNFARRHRLAAGGAAGGGLATGAPSAPATPPAVPEALAKEWSTLAPAERLAKARQWHAEQRRESA
jgi:hypothetical protein